MTIFEMLQQSAVLTILGMTVVFVFLWIMVVCVNLSGFTTALKEKISAEENAEVEYFVLCVNITKQGENNGYKSCFKGKMGYWRHRQ
jgi:Na+-transporting methylmalonyl-CoA/oxaloacetate decarboxylase gamma subunit